MGVRLLLLKVLTSRLTVRDYGTYAFWTAAASMATIVFGAELYRYLQRHAREVADGGLWLRSQLIGETAFIIATTLVVSLLHFTPLASELSLPGGRLLVLVATLAWSELMIVELVRFAVLAGRGAAGEGAKLIRSCVTVALVLALPALSTERALLAVVGANIVAIVVLSRLAAPQPSAGRPSAAVVERQLLTMLSHAALFIIPALANQLLKVGDRFFVFGALSAEELARYSVAYNLQLLCFGATGGLASTLVYPLVLRDAAQNTPRGNHRWLFVQLAIQTLASATLFLLSGPLVGLVSSPAYGDAVPLVRALTPLPVLMVLSGAMLMQFLATGQRRRYAAVTVCGAGLAVALYAVLVPRLGVNGAVIGTLAGYAGTAMLAGLTYRSRPDHAVSITSTEPSR